MEPVPPAPTYAIDTQPVSVGLQSAPGSSPVNGVIVRHLQDTQEDAEFAANLTVEAFREKFAHNVTNQK